LITAFIAYTSLRAHL